MKFTSTIASTSLLISIGMLAACSKYEPPAEEPSAQEPSAPVGKSSTSPIDESGPVSLDPKVAIPGGLAADAIKVSECMTPVDYFNGVAPTTAPYAAGSPVVAIGWNVTDSKTDATPDGIYGVFKPYDKTADGSLLNGKRVPRPDVSAGNDLYENAGYELSGSFPSKPGKYRFYVWTGTASALAECDSKIVINVQ